MKEAFKSTVDIDRPIAEVWDALTNWDNAAKWMNGVDALRAEGATLAGTRLIFTARGKERESTIAACEAGRSITLRSVQGGVTADYRYDLEGVDEGKSRLTLTAGCSVQGLGWKLMYPFIRMAIKASDSGQPLALKHTLVG